MMRDMQAAASSRWPDSLLDELRTVGDSLGDRAVRELGHDRRAGLDFFAAVHERAGSGGAACRALLEQVNTVPEWTSFPRMRAGCALALSHPVATGLALLCGSLVESYASALGAKVLVRTGNLERATRRRVYETGDFLHTLARDYGARPGTAGHRALVNLRLLHARIRLSMQHRADWDARWGLPVNQEDYSSTLLMFSLVFARSLQRLGLALSDSDIDSLHHGWRYAGHVMGVDPRLLTESPAAEQALYDQITRRQHHPDADSRDLVRSLFTSMGWQPPFFLPTPAQQVVSRALIGDSLADALAIPEVATLRRAPQLLAGLGQLQGRLLRTLPGLPLLYERLGRRFFALVLRYGLSAQHPPVELH
jgi:hypothetical protein